MNKICIVLLLGLVLTTTTAQPTNNVAKAEGMISILSLCSRFFFCNFYYYYLGECRYEQALACAVEMEDLILDCIRQDMDHIPGCVVDGLGGIDGGNPCIWCVCTVLQMVGLSC